MRERYKRFVLILSIIFIFLPGLEAQTQGIDFSVTTEEVTDVTYKIRPFDQLVIEFTYVNEALEPEIRRSEYQVSADGYISHELAGDVKVSGLTILEAQKRIDMKLSRFIKEPRTKLHVLKKAEKHILLYGRISGYGLVPLERDLTIGELLISRGGPLPDADPTRIVIRRKGKGTFTFNFERYLYEGDESENIVLENGDIIIVPEKVPEREIVSQYSKDFKLQPGNEVEIAINEASRIGISPEPPEKYTIDEDGNIYHRIFGLVKIAGLTISEAEKQLQEVAKAYYVDPIVEFKVTQIVKRSVYVFGEVARPGVYPLPRNLRLSEFLATLGGFSGEADLKRIIVSRQSGDIIEFNLEDYLLKNDNTNNVYLENGDKIVVQKKKLRFSEKLAQRIQPYITIFQAINAFLLVWLYINGRLTG